MFGNKYKKAYNAIAPSQELVLETIKRAKAEKNGDEKKPEKMGLCRSWHLLQLRLLYVL